MPDPTLDLDLLATHLRNKIKDDDLSVRAAARQIGCSPATLTRLLQGSAAAHVPDARNLIRAASWLGKSLSDFAAQSAPQPATLGDVEVHLRSLPGLSQEETEGLVAMVRAVVEAAARKHEKKKSPGR